MLNSDNRLRQAPIRPITVPLWLGAERRGVEAGAAAISQGLATRWSRVRLEAHAERLREPYDVPVLAPIDADHRLHRREMAFLPEIAAACEHLAGEITRTIGAGELAVTLGGDHAVGLGSLAGAAGACERLGVIWFDTHLDLNTPETSPSGHIHGMAVAAALGYGPRSLVDLGSPGAKLDPANLCYLGIRDIDPGERDLIERHQLWMLTMEEWSDQGILIGLETALDHLTSRGVDAVHISFDVDVLDPSIMPGTGTSVVGGLTYREAAQIARRLHAWDGPIRSVDWVELNPSLDPTGGSTTVAVALLATLLGETVR